MDQKTEQQFIKLAQFTDERAGSIECSKRDYITGLAIVISELEMAKEAAEVELEAEVEDDV